MFLCILYIFTIITNGDHFFLLYNLTPLLIRYKVNKFISFVYTVWQVTFPVMYSHNDIIISMKIKFFLITYVSFLWTSFMSSHNCHLIRPSPLTALFKGRMIKYHKRCKRYYLYKNLYSIISYFSWTKKEFIVDIISFNVYKNSVIFINQDWRRTRFRNRNFKLRLSS